MVFHKLLDLPTENLMDLHTNAADHFQKVKNNLSANTVSDETKGLIKQILDALTKACAESESSQLGFLSLRVLALDIIHMVNFHNKSDILPKECQMSNEELLGAYKKLEPDIISKDEIVDRIKQLETKVSQKSLSL